MSQRYKRVSFEAFARGSAGMMGKQKAINIKGDVGFGMRIVQFLQYSIYDPVGLVGPIVPIGFGRKVSGIIGLSKSLIQMS
jgi:hypothetical protein